MLIIKFKKEHVAGIEKGAIKEVSDKFAERMISEGYAEKSNEADLIAYNGKVRNKPKPDHLTSAKESANSSNGDCAECGDNPDCEDCKEKNGGVVEDKKYHVLSQEDIDANGLGEYELEVGDEVEIDANGDFVQDEDGNLFKKDLGNV